MPSLYEQLLYDDELLELPEIEYLIEGVLDLNSTALLFGDSGAGKSAIALDWALSVASGQRWDGHAVRQRKVLYVIGEGLHGTARRYESWRDYHDQRDGMQVWWGPEAPNILDAGSKRELIECVAKVEPSFTILDTVARHIPGGDENSFQTMSQVVEVMDRIKVMTGGCVLAVHHTGKSAEQGARGHSSLRGAIDTEIHCTKGPTLAVTKQKNHPDGFILGGYELLRVNGGIVPVPRARRRSENETKALSALADLGKTARYGEWKAAAGALGLPAGSFDRVRDRLAEDGIVTMNDDQEWTITGPF